jgi:hypothetical protein
MTKNTDDEETVKAVNAVALEVLKDLLEDYVHMTEADEAAQSRYQTNFLGDLYARMVMSFIMGYDPDVMAEEAIQSAGRLHKLVLEEEEEDESNTD